MATFSESIQSFLQNCEINGFSQDSLASYGGSVSLFGAFANKPVEAIQPTDISAWKESLHQKGNVLSTIILRLTHIKQFFTYATDMKLCPESPFVDSLLPSKSKLQSIIDDASAFDLDAIHQDMGDYKHQLSMDQYKKLLSPIRPSNHHRNNFLRDRAIVSLLLSSGLRASEACNLRIKHINFDRDFLLVVNGKGSKTAPVPLYSVAKAYLMEYLSTRSLSPDAYVFNISNRNQLSLIVMRYVKHSIGVDGIRAHALRHGLAVILKNAGVDVDIREDIMRHSPTNPLDRRYAGSTRMDVMQQQVERAFGCL